MVHSKLLIKFLLLVLTSCVFASCDSGKKQSEETVKNFFRSLNSNQETNAEKYYPGIKHFDRYYVSDSIVILETEKQTSASYCVKVNSLRFKSNGSVSERKMNFFVEKTDSVIDGVQYKIWESYGLSAHRDDNLYRFAKSTGCLTDFDECLDCNAERKMLDAKILFDRYCFDFKMELVRNVYIDDYKWESFNNRQSARVWGIVKNESPYDLNDVKYNVKYQDYDGNTITEDDGYLFYNTFRAYSSRSFSIYSSYIGNSRRAYASIEFDKSFIEKEVLNRRYTGKEYEEYKAGKE